MLYLLTTYAVQEKVIFSLVSVILFMGRGRRGYVLSWSSLGGGGTLTKSCLGGRRRRGVPLPGDPTTWFPDQVTPPFIPATSGLGEGYPDQVTPPQARSFHLIGVWLPYTDLDSKTSYFQFICLDEQVEVLEK